MSSNHPCVLQFLQCKLTLRKERGDNCNFFAFADTLTTKVATSYFDALADFEPAFCSSCIDSAAAVHWQGTAVQCPPDDVNALTSGKELTDTV